MRDLLPPTVAVAVAGPADRVGELLAAEQACLSDQAVPTTGGTSPPGGSAPVGR